MISPSVKILNVDREKKSSQKRYQVSGCHQVSKCELLNEKKTVLERSIKFRDHQVSKCQLLIEKNQFSKNVSSFVISPSVEMSTVDREKTVLEKFIKFRDITKCRNVNC